MILEFFLSHVLKRVLTLPISVGLVYPSIGADIVLRNAELRPEVSDSAAEAKGASFARIPYAKIDLKWSSLADEVLIADSVYLEGADIQIDVQSPARLAHCLQNKACISPRLVRARMQNPAQASQLSEEVKPVEKGESLPELKMFARHFEVQESHVVLKSDKAAHQFEIVSLSGENIAVPLDGSGFTLRADVLYRTAARVAAIRAQFNWSGDSDDLVVALVLRDFPVEVIENLLPEVSGSMHGLLGQGKSSGRLSGNISLHFSAEQKRWSLH